VPTSQANILLSKTNAVKVCDLGLCTFFNAQKAMDVTRTANVGTVGPEPVCATALYRLFIIAQQEVDVTRTANVGTVGTRVRHRFVSTIPYTAEGRGRDAHRQRRHGAPISVPSVVPITTSVSSLMSPRTPPLVTI
jgi:hypothetical protein